MGERHEEPSQGDEDSTTADETGSVHSAPEVTYEDDQQCVSNLQQDTQTKRSHKGRTGAWEERLPGGLGEASWFSPH